MLSSGSMNNSNLDVSLEIVLFSLIAEKLHVYVQNCVAAPYMGKYCLPQGDILFTEDNTIEEAIMRTVKALQFKSLSYIEQVKTIGGIARDPRGWSLAVVYYGFVAADQVIDSTNVKWIAIENLQVDDFAFDHALIVQESHQRLKSKALYTSLPAFLLPEEFTLTDLQKAYEAVLDCKIEKKSFRRRMLDAHILVETEKVRRANHRPAQVYQLIDETPHIFNRIIEGARH